MSKAYRSLCFYKNERSEITDVIVISTTDVFPNSIFCETKVCVRIVLGRVFWKIKFYAALQAEMGT